MAEEINEELINMLIGYFNQKIDFESNRNNELIELTSKLATEVRKSTERELTHLMILEKIFSDHATRLSVSLNRPRSEIVDELNLDIAKSFPQTQLRVV